MWYMTGSIGEFISVKKISGKQSARKKFISPAWPAASVKRRNCLKRGKFCPAIVPRHQEIHGRRIMR
jgi:hypothetical protein